MSFATDHLQAQPQRLRSITRLHHRLGRPVQPILLHCSRMLRSPAHLEVSPSSDLHRTLRRTASSRGLPTSRSTRCLVQGTLGHTIQLLSSHELLSRPMVRRIPCRRLHLHLHLHGMHRLLSQVAKAVDTMEEPNRGISLKRFPARSLRSKVSASTTRPGTTACATIG